MTVVVYKKQDKVLIHEGEGKGLEGYVMDTQEGNFGKQWIDVSLNDSKPREWVRKRASDVTLVGRH